MVTLILYSIWLLLVHKHSPMLSILLSIEEEDEPLWNSWSPIAMCMEIIFMPLHLLLVLQLLLIVVKLCPQSLFTPSSPLSLLSFVVASSRTNFSCTSRTECVLNFCSNATHSKLSFQRVIICPKRLPNKRVMPFFTPRLQSVPSWFQNARPPMFLP